MKYLLNTLLISALAFAYSAHAAPEGKDAISAEDKKQESARYIDPNTLADLDGIDEPAFEGATPGISKIATIGSGAFAASSADELTDITQMQECLPQIYDCQAKASGCGPTDVKCLCGKKDDIVKQCLAKDVVSKMKGCEKIDVDSIDKGFVAQCDAGMAASSYSSASAQPSMTSAAMVFAGAAAMVLLH